MSEDIVSWKKNYVFTIFVPSLYLDRNIVSGIQDDIWNIGHHRVTWSPHLIDHHSIDLWSATFISVYIYTRMHLIDRELGVSMLATASRVLDAVWCGGGRMVQTWTNRASMAEAKSVAWVWLLFNGHGGDRLEYISHSCHWRRGWHTPREADG